MLHFVPLLLGILQLFHWVNDLLLSRHGIVLLPSLHSLLVLLLYHVLSSDRRLDILCMIQLANECESIIYSIIEYLDKLQG